MCTALGAAASIVVSLMEPTSVNSAGLIDPKCLILRKLLGGVGAARWFNLKCNLVVLWKNQEKKSCCSEKYLLESVRCWKTECKTRVILFDSSECPVCNIRNYQCYLNYWSSAEQLEERSQHCAPKELCVNTLQTVIWEALRIQL